MPQRRSWGPSKWVGDRVSQWQSEADRIREAKITAQEARYKAEAELALWRAKADVEWDMEWAKGASSSWKDELLLIMWSLPTIGLFVPFLRPYVIEGFDYLQTFNPDAPEWFMAGWAIIFSATFGIKQAIAYMMPGKYAQLATAIGALPDDIPAAAIKAIEAKPATK